MGYGSGNVKCLPGTNAVCAPSSAVHASSGAGGTTSATAIAGSTNSTRRQGFNSGNTARYTQATSAAATRMFSGVGWRAGCGLMYCTVSYTSLSICL